MTQRAEQNLAVARAALVEVVERTVQLRKSGREFIGICPFHEERTASFTVVPTKGFYHCFGCGAHGAAIDFVMRTEHVGFGEALRSIVAKAPIATPIEPRERIARSEAKRPTSIEEPGDGSQALAGESRSRGFGCGDLPEGGPADHARRTADAPPSSISRVLPTKMAQRDDTGRRCSASCKGQIVGSAAFT